MLTVIALLLAAICFILGACGVSRPPINWVALGLLFWILTILVPACAAHM